MKHRNPNADSATARNFRRSDARIKQDVCAALFRAPHIDASEIEVDVQDGVVTLMGTVTERHLKPWVETCTAGVGGVRGIRNRLNILEYSSNRAGDLSPDIKAFQPLLKDVHA